ncbi:MAG TPA: hypothetical protein VMT73_09065, partial [Anaerolineales bacterium]|nr:hypothetical protein [Anaerolineales bacterium]
TITFSEPVSGVDTSDFALTTSGVAGASITNVTLVSGATYSVSVNTGSGSGTIRLDLVDNDSIVDATNTPLGGAGAGNGNFTSGETYTIDKSITAVTSITRADANPTSANSVRFTVTFSAAVSGVDASDFALTTAGISGASVSDVSGSGTTYIVTVNTGTGDGTLRLDLIDNDSIIDAMNNPLGGAGAGNGNFTNGEIYTINKNAPVVTSILRADPNPTNADSVRYLVSFSEPVTGVDASDFILTTSGVSGANVTNVSGSGNSYVVTVTTGSNSGTLRLDVIDNDSILDSGGLPLGGAGISNGNFTSGETYTVNKPAVTLVTQTFTSNGADDGWVLESSESSNKGGSTNSNGTIINIGDDAKNRQYRAILEFPTSSLPDNAVITMAILTIKRQGLIGTDPFTTNGNILIDIRKGAFGNFGPFSIAGLQASDFQAPAGKSAVGAIANNPVSSWYWSALDTSAFPYINLTGITQFRLRFQLDDNNNKKDDYLKFFSGNYNVTTDRPQLQVTYYVPQQQSQITPVSIPTIQAFGPALKWTTGNQGVKWAEVSFDDIAPHGMNLKECWDAMGMDSQGRVYIGFTSLRADGRDDFAVFRYNQATGERVFLGSFLDIVAASGNAQAGENIPKGHTRMVYTNGQLYMGSQNFHDLKGAIDSLPTYRGSHLFDFDTTNGLWTELSAALPGGVVTAHEGIISLNILPQEHLLIGLAHPSSNIILYDYQAEKLISIIPGIPWKLGNPLSREVIVAPSGNIYTYRGTEDVSQLNETHSVWVTNIHTGETKDTGFQMTKGFWVGQTEKRDGSKIYINTIGGELYEFDVASETFRDLGYELPSTDNRIIDYTYDVSLSPDESRLYYVLSILQKPTGALGNGGSGELYYYDLTSKQIVFVQQLPVGIYTSADLRDSQNMYFAHFGDTSNLWTGNPRLFILHVS